MMIRLDYADNKYLEKHYSIHMNILNSGGLTFVSGEFFVFGMRLMTFVRELFTVQIMNNNPKHGFKIAKKAVLENNSLSNYFRALCIQHSGLQGTNLEMAVSAVYNMVLPKVIHSRFAVIFLWWREIHVKSKEKPALRPALKVGVSNKAKKDSTTKTPKKTKTKVHAVTPNFSERQCTLNRKRRREVLYEKRQGKKREYDRQRVDCYCD